MAGVVPDGPEEFAENEDFAWMDEEGSPLLSSPSRVTPGKDLIKEVCRLIRVARGHWDAHHNTAARRARGRALSLYATLSREQREQVPQVLRIWLRYRSNKYYGET